VPRPSDKRTIRLAAVLYSRLGEPAISELYNSLRRTIYGIPAGSVEAADLLHELADLLGKPDPSETD
jgi:hypothetical protein